MIEIEVGKLSELQNLIVKKSKKEDNKDYQDIVRYLPEK
jgi:hypothetical protein